MFDSVMRASMARMIFCVPRSFKAFVLVWSWIEFYWDSDIDEVDIKVGMKSTKSERRAENTSTSNNFVKSRAI